MTGWRDPVYRLIVALELEPFFVRVCDVMAEHIARHPRLYSWLPAPEQDK